MPSKIAASGGGGVGGSTGATDGALLKASGVGGSTLAASGILVDATNHVSNLRQTVTAHTIDATLSASAAFTILVNDGAGGEVILTLPTIIAAVVGVPFEFYVSTAQYLRVKAPTGRTIRVFGSATASGGYIRSNTVGSVLVVKCVSTTQYAVFSQDGTWSIDS